LIAMAKDRKIVWDYLLTQKDRLNEQIIKDIHKVRSEYVFHQSFMANLSYLKNKKFSIQQVYNINSELVKLVPAAFKKGLYRTAWFFLYRLGIYRLALLKK